MPPSLGPPPPTRDSLELASLASSSLAHDEATSALSSSSSLSSRRLSLLGDDLPPDHDPPLGRAAANARSYSVSSAFDFAGNLFPLSSTMAGGGYAPLGAPASALASATGGSLEKHKTLTYLNGLSLIVGLIIGSGIFSSPSQVSSRVGSAGAALVVWVVAGVLAWTGAASYAELGGAIPLNGGSQVYLAKTFGELLGFLFAWVAVLVLKPGSAAIVAIIMAEYLVRALIGVEAETVNPWVNKSVALCGLVLVTLLNCISTRLGARVNDLMMILKLTALFGVAITGLVVAVTGHRFQGGNDAAWGARDWFQGTSTDLSNWAVALYGGLWAFDGWDNTNYVVGEFRHPSRDLPRVIHTAMPLVIVSYVLANIAYFLVLPRDAINSSNTIAVLFGSVVFGPVGALVLALVVSATCFGSLNSSVFTAGRLVYVAGKEGYMPALFGRIGTLAAPPPAPDRSRCRLARCLRRCLGDGDDVGLFYTPIYALLFNALLTAAYCLVGEFDTLVTFYGVAGYSFYFLTVLGLIVLRVKEPRLERPYRTWITTPIIFCCVSLFLLSRAVFARPLQSLSVVAFVLAGIPIYYWRIGDRDQVGPRAASRPDAAATSPTSGPWWAFWKRKRPSRR